VGVEVRQFVEFGVIAVEVAEEALEDVGHHVPRRPHVEAESVPFEDARPTAEGVVLLDDGDVEARVGEVTRAGEPAEAGADHDDLGVGSGRHQSLLQGTTEPTAPSPRGVRFRIAAESPPLRPGLVPVTSCGTPSVSGTGLTR